MFRITLNNENGKQLQELAFDEASNLAPGEMFEKTWSVPLKDSVEAAKGAAYTQPSVNVQRVELADGTVLAFQ